MIREQDASPQLRRSVRTTVDTTEGPGRGLGQRPGTGAPPPLVSAGGCGHRSEHLVPAEARAEGVAAAGEHCTRDGSQRGPRARRQNRWDALSGGRRAGRERRIAARRRPGLGGRRHATITKLRTLRHATALAALAALAPQKSPCSMNM
eukprot:gene16930-biopygen10200